MNVYDDLDFLKRLIKGIAEEFGSDCEVAIHDLKAGYEHSIIAIENGHVTGRKVGMLHHELQWKQFILIFSMKIIIVIVPVQMMDAF